MKTRWTQGLMVLAVAMVTLSPAMIPMTGCHKNQPLPLNAVTPLDGNITAALLGAHRAVEQYTTDVKAKVHTPSDTEKAAVNVVIRAINVAQPLAIAYHNALLANPMAPEPAELSSALTNVTVATQSLQSMLAQGVKAK